MFVDPVADEHTRQVTLRKSQIVKKKDNRSNIKMHDKWSELYLSSRARADRAKADVRTTPSGNKLGPDGHRRISLTEVKTHCFLDLVVKLCSHVM